MSYLKEGEWIIINDIIMSVYSSSTLDEMRLIFLDKLSKLISYEICTFYQVDISHKNILINPVGVNMRSERLYNEYYYKVDYAKNVFSVMESTIYRDTDLLSNNERERTEFYNDFLKNIGVHFAAGTTLAYNQCLLGSVNIFRPKYDKDFSSRDLFILKQLQHHLAFRLFQFENDSIIINNRNLVKKFNLTDREMEIINLVLQGFSNFEISQRLFISLDTVKKHLSNVFRKLEIKSRTQLTGHFFHEVYS